MRVKPYERADARTRIGRYWTSRRCRFSPGSGRSVGAFSGSVGSVEKAIVGRIEVATLVVVGTVCVIVVPSFYVDRREPSTRRLAAVLLRRALTARRAWWNAWPGGPRAENARDAAVARVANAGSPKAPFH